MTAVAILVGCSDYSSMNPLPCCRIDVEAMAALIEATGRFDMIHPLLDSRSAEVKGQLRAALEPIKRADEIFFYFSGHGHSDDGEFYFCPCDFDHRRPNETGLSNGELHALLRESSPELAVKVIDACNSGALLIKSGGDFPPHDKGGLKNLVQMASCLDSQTSLTGDPLSEFTEKFCLAASRRTEGPVYYTDIISVLRDEYRRNQERSPHFVFQASARETFTEDAARLASFRDKFSVTWMSKPAVQVSMLAPADPATVPAESPGLVELLTQTEARVVKPENVPALINALFDGLKTRLASETFGECFDLAVTEHAGFYERTTRRFIIQVLNQENRQDDFVTATITRERKRQRTIPGVSSALESMFEEFVENWDLRLNMRMDRAQLRVTLTPRFSALQRIVLVVSCAPSLEHCYVFELMTRHPRTDWTTFANEGSEVTRRWYKLTWRQDVSWLVDKIAEKLETAVKDHLVATAERLSKS